MVAEMSPSLAKMNLMLSEMQDLVAEFQDRCRSDANENPASSDLSARALALYRARRARESSFGDHGDLFGEPAWDTLLDLFVAREAGRRVSVSSACIAADVPATTALRWLSLLEQRGLVERCADSGDGRRIYIGLSDTAHALMCRWLDRWA
jgi:DNA-binding MarR family transcriptional regulator